MISRPIYDTDPAADAHAFRRCLAQFSTGVTVITARVDDKLVGMTANSFSSVSLAPPLVLWSIGKTSSRFLFFQSAEHFVVNVLADDQIALSRHFERAAPDQFRKIDWTAGGNGAPVLVGTAAAFECRREAEHEAGDHVIIIGRVGRMLLFERRVLLFSQGRYRVPADHPDDVMQIQGRDDQASIANDSLILSSLFRANHKLSAIFSRYREGMTRDQHRVLIGIERRPGVTFEEVVRDTCLGAQAAADAVAALIESGLIAASSEGGLSLTDAGRARRRSLVKHLADMERELLNGIPEHVVHAGRQLLQRLAED